MSRKLRHTSKPPARQLPWLPIIAGGAILLVIVGLAIWWRSASSGPATPPQAGGGTPKLVIDRTTIDDGYVKFETPIQAAFKISNTGNQPLQILNEPQVELIEGC
jgi:hypothetical protein